MGAEAADVDGLADLFVASRGGPDQLLLTGPALGRRIDWWGLMPLIDDERDN